MKVFTLLLLSFVWPAAGRAEIRISLSQNPASGPKIRLPSGALVNDGALVSIGTYLTAPATPNEIMAGFFEFARTAIGRDGVPSANGVIIRGGAQGLAGGTAPESPQPDSFFAGRPVYLWIHSAPAGQTAPFQGLYLSLAVFPAENQPVTVPISMTTFTQAFTVTGGSSSHVDAPAGSALGFTLGGANLTALEAWRLQHFGSSLDAGPGANGADADRDGIANLAEFGFGLPPWQSSTALVPRAMLDTTGLTFTYTPPAGVSGITYSGEFSTSLLPGSWQPVADSSHGAGVLFHVPASGTARLFFRVNVSDGP